MQQHVSCQTLRVKKRRDLNNLAINSLCLADVKMGSGDLLTVLLKAYSALL